MTNFSDKKVNGTVKPNNNNELFATALLFNNLGYLSQTKCLTPPKVWYTVGVNKV